MNLRPEDVQFMMETVLGPSGSEIEREVEQDLDLRAAFERARDDISTGRVTGHDEVVEWHRNHPK